MSKFILSVLLVAFALLNAAEAQRVAFGFGTNAVGEQGRAVSSPTKIEQIPALEGKNISMITTGNMFTLVHTNMPYATYAFGRNVEGQLGLGNNANTATPTPIPALNGVQVLSMAAGSNFAVVITAGNNVYSMGDNSFGQLGLNDTTARNTPTLIPYFNQPAVKANMVNSVSCGTSHCHIYTSTNDTVAPYGMGKNDVGQLLLGNRNSSLVPRQLSLTGVAQVSCGADYTLARNTQGLVFCGGSNAMGQCGKNNTEAVSEAGPILNNGATFSSVQACNGHSLAISSTGKLWAWGSNSNGQAGMNSTQSMFTVPMPVGPVAIENATMIGCGDNYSVFVNTQNVLFGFGSNAQKQVGLDTPAGDIRAPFPVINIQMIANITMGQQYTYVLSNGNSHSVGHISGPNVPQPTLPPTTAAPTTAAPTTAAPTTAPTTPTPGRSGAKQTVASGFLIAIAAILFAQF